MVIGRGRSLSSSGGMVTIRRYYISFFEVCASALGNQIFKAGYTGRSLYGYDLVLGLSLYGSCLLVCRF